MNTVFSEVVTSYIVLRLLGLLLFFLPIRKKEDKENGEEKGGGRAGRLILTGLS